VYNVFVIYKHTIHTGINTLYTRAYVGHDLESYFLCVRNGYDCRKCSIMSAELTEIVAAAIPW